jgi:uncharacterized Tic20 family protein
MSEWPAKPADQNERNAAAACHIAGIFFPYLAPIVALALSCKRSRFVQIHALESLFEAIALTVFTVVVFAVSLAISLPGLLELLRSRGESFEWSMVWAALIKSAIVWIGLVLVGLWYTIRSALDALQAIRGEWKPSLVSGRLAAKFLGVDRRSLSAKAQ